MTTGSVGAGSWEEKWEEKRPKDRKSRSGPSGVAKYYATMEMVFIKTGKLGNVCNVLLNGKHRLGNAMCIITTMDKQVRVWTEIKRDLKSENSCASEAGTWVR